MSRATFYTFPNKTLHIEKCSAIHLAEEFGTPLYVYSRAALTEAYKAYSVACEGRNAKVHYAVKANSNIGILSLFAKLGAGFDIVSGGELTRVLMAGGKADKIVFSGVGKSETDIHQALKANIKCFNVESESELHCLNKIAKNLGLTAPVSFRVNPDVDPKTHPYISTGLKTSKFGLPFETALAAYEKASKMENIQIVGIDCHIGSQITDISPYINALDKILELVIKIEEKGIKLDHIDMGGGLGICYQNENIVSINEFIGQILDYRDNKGFKNRQIWFEPGRSIVGNAGILLTRVEYIKTGEEKNFAIVDAAMNDLARPAMYNAYHQIESVSENQPENNLQKKVYNVVGPVCESGDWLGFDRHLCIEEKDFLAIYSVGAYGFTMSSNYNTRPRAAEVIVDDENAYLVRKRETIEQLIAGESCL